MKKLMIAAAIVCAAAVSQAATFNWTSDARAFGVSPASVTDNGNYKASTAKADRIDKCSLTYLLTIYAAGTDTLIGTQSGSVVEDSGYFSTSGIEVAAAKDGTTYDYVLTITGTQNSLTAKGQVGDYDYSAAKISTQISGTITTDPMGATALVTDVPTTWAVSDITKKEPEPTPEPTSAMLMLLGVAGLALRRKVK